jgi:hypothetical protein
VSRSRLPNQVAAWSDGAVGTLRLKDEGEVTGPVDNTGRERKSSRSTHPGPARGSPVSGGKICPTHVGVRMLEGLGLELSQPQFWLVL